MNFESEFHSNVLKTFNGLFDKLSSSVHSLSEYFKISDRNLKTFSQTRSKANSAVFAADKNAQYFEVLRRSLRLPVFGHKLRYQSLNVDVVPVCSASRAELCDRLRSRLSGDDQPQEPATIQVFESNQIPNGVTPLFRNVRRIIPRNDEFDDCFALSGLNSVGCFEFDFVD
jgi:hypothetical protein